MSSDELEFSIAESVLYESTILKMRLKYIFLFLSLSWVGFGWAQDDQGIYKVGAGISDITGPPAGTPLNGFIGWLQAAGIYTRTYARAFAIESLSSGNVVVYVTCDMGMIDHSLVAEVVKKLQGKYGDKISNKNVMISATHTHSGVSGFMTYYAFLLIESKGFNPISYWNAVDGIYDAIDIALRTSQPGHAYWTSGVLETVNENRRSNNAYLENPLWERNLFNTTVDVRMDMIVLKGLDDSPVGAFTWFPVHPEDFNEGGDNPLVSSDHKGYAALLFDAKLNPGKRPGQGNFVSGFGSANLGDVYTVYGDADPPVPPRPQPEDPDVTPRILRMKYAGQRQFAHAWDLWEDVESHVQITGPIGYAHHFVDVIEERVPHFNESSGEIETVSLCKPAMGVAYFTEFDPEEDLWKIIRDLIKVPSEEMIECQAPKGVFIAAGEMNEPWPWAPSIFTVQYFRIGSISLLGLPGEFTTMSGRRVRRAVQNITESTVILAGLCNNYINYIATPEEYDLQKFEGGATIFGRNTVPVVTHWMTEMASAVLDNAPNRIPDGPTPPSFLDLLRPEVVTWVDPPLSFGSLVQDAEPEYDSATDSQVSVVFVAGSPRNSALRKGTFLLVEKKNTATGRWDIMRTDADHDTMFYWRGPEVREVEIRWLIHASVAPGTYRIRHFGYYKLEADEVMHNYDGQSREFLIK